MSCLTATIVLAIAGLTGVTGQLQLPCDSVLRRLSSFAHLFTHCDCLRSDWGEWMAINRTAVPASQCPSLSSLTYQRRQIVIDGACRDIVEYNAICKWQHAKELFVRS